MTDKQQKELKRIKDKQANLFFYAQLTKDYTIFKNMEVKQ